MPILFETAAFEEMPKVKLIDLLKQYSRKFPNPIL
jgi:hypothetical protein